MHVDTKPVEAETKMSSVPDLAIARLIAAQLHTWWIRTRRAGNLKRLVLGCIEAVFRKQKLVGKFSPRSTQCTPFHSSPISQICRT